MYNDITESLMEQLENDEISSTEAGFMIGEENAGKREDDEEETEEDE